MTTSTPKSTKVGRPPSEARRFAREMFSEWSDRTFARWWWAAQVLRELAGPEGYQAAIAASTRRNGTLNVAAFERHAWRAIAEEAGR